MSDELNDLRRENAELRAELLSRAEKDAEDMHRLQERYSHLYRQFESLQKWVARGMALQPPPPIIVQADDTALFDTVMHAGDMEHARMSSLLDASTNLLNQLALLTRDDESYLWRIGGRPLDDAYKALKRATTAVRPQADALLAELRAARAVVAQSRLCGVDGGCTDEEARQWLATLRAYDEATKAKSE